MRHLEPSSLPSGWRRALWLALVVASSVAFTLCFACAVPFAALGSAAAMTLSRRDALILTGAAWLANQVIGFLFLSYPLTAASITWGLVLGLASITTTLVAEGLVERLGRQGAVVAALASLSERLLHRRGTAVGLATKALLWDFVAARPV